VNFGSGINYTNGTNTFMLQPGIYLVHLSAIAHQIFAANQSGFATMFVLVRVNGIQADGIGGAGVLSPGSTSSAAILPVIGDVLLQISGANTIVGFEVLIGNSTSLPVGCRIIFTRLQ
jgi:hypothetical protein